MKKVLIFSIGFFILAIGIAYYFVFQRPVQEMEGTAVDQGLLDPFGGPASDRTPITNTGSTTISTDPENVQIKDLTRISIDPVAGSYILTNKSSSTKIRYTERATGHIHDVSLSTGEVVRVSNTTIPKIYESHWSTSSTTIFRYIGSNNETIQSYVARLVASGTDSLAKIQGLFLPENIGSVSNNPSGSRIFYITESASGSQGVTANADGSKRTAIFSSALNDWVGQWASDSTITVTNKASANVLGHLYFLDINGNMRKITSGAGLTTLTNTQATYVALSTNNLRLSLLDVKTGFNRATNVRTLPEKCVWSTKQRNILYCAVPTMIDQGQFPDAWYKGLVSFTDEIYKIDANTGSATVIGALVNRFNENIDAINLVLSPTEDYISFINKKDLSLWALKIQ